MTHDSVPPDLSGVVVTPNRDSARLALPAFAGAADFRAYALPAQVKLQADGTESLSGTTVYCAGLVQHNTKATDVAEVLPLIEVDGLSGPTDVVVEAIDRLCPFPGLISGSHHDITVTNPEVDAKAMGVFSLFTEAEVIATYGALIINGQGPAAKPGQPAAPNPPKVLARTTVHVVPTGNGAPVTADFFEDFGNAADQPVFVKSLSPPVEAYHTTQNAQLWQTSKLSIYSYGSQHYDDGAGKVADNSLHPYVARGALHMTLADWEDDIFGSVFVYPRKLVHPSLTDYLHITYEVQANSTNRRYAQIVVCGADVAGQTMNAGGEVLGDIIQSPFFFNPDGLNPVLQAWNCFQMFSLDGTASPFGPDNKSPESVVGLMVNLPDKTGPDLRKSVVNVSPDQLKIQYPGPGNGNLGQPGWYRQMSNLKFTGPMLDDKLTVGARVHFDLWLRRDRAVLFVDGQQRLCNDFPSVALTMPEAVLGFGQVLYHSAAERDGFNVPYWVRNGQRYYLDDAPFADHRSWDNIGFQEHVTSVPGLDESACFKYGP